MRHSAICPLCNSLDARSVAAMEDRQQHPTARRDAGSTGRTRADAAHPATWPAPSSGWSRGGPAEVELIHCREVEAARLRLSRGDRWTPALQSGQTERAAATAGDAGSWNASATPPVWCLGLEPEGTLPFAMTAACVVDAQVAQPVAMLGIHMESQDDPWLVRAALLRCSRSCV